MVPELELIILLPVLLLLLFSVDGSKLVIMQGKLVTPFRAIMMCTASENQSRFFRYPPKYVLTSVSANPMIRDLPAQS